MPRKDNEVLKTKKVCSCCHIVKPRDAFFKSKSPLFSVDQRVPICDECVYMQSVNASTGLIDVEGFNNVLRIIDKPYYKDLLEQCTKKVHQENPYISPEDLPKFGNKILRVYFRYVQMKQYSLKSYSDSVSEGYLFNKKINIEESNNKTPNNPDITSLEQLSNMVNSKDWRGLYSVEDIDYLDKYYSGLERDYKIITENHRDYARKIAKASLQMDKAFNDMMNGVSGADLKYKNAREAFDTLSKSAKFSESTRSVNDVGISSFSKIASMVESHNWIPEHKPIKKDQIDELIDYLSTITKSI